MAHSRTRNMLVGIVVMFALGIFAWLVFKVGSAPATLFQPAQIHVNFSAERADGLGNGSNISYKGLSVGRIMGVERDPSTDNIVIRAALWKRERLPANLAGDIIFTSPLGAVSTLSLRLAGAAPQGEMAEGATLPTRFVGSTFIPPEFGELAHSLNDTVKQFNDAHLLEKVAKAVDQTTTEVTAAGDAIRGISSLVNDQKLRADLAKTLEAVAATADDARTISARIRSLSDRFDPIVASAQSTVDKTNVLVDHARERLDALAAQAGDSLQKLSQSMDAIHSIAGKLDKGVGTMGQLVNDPKLYQALIDSAAELRDALKDVRRLVQQWEQEGFSLRFGK